MSQCDSICWDLHKAFPHRLPHRRVLRAESGLLLSFGPAQHLSNTCLDPHVVQSHLKFSVECHEDCCTCPCLQLCSSVCHSHPVRSVAKRVSACVLATCRAKADSSSGLAATSGMSLSNTLPSVRTAGRVLLSVSVYSFFEFPSSSSRISLTCSKSVSPFSSPSSSLKVSAAASAHTSSSFPCASFQAMSSPFFWRSSVICVSNEFFSDLPHPSSS